MSINKRDIVTLDDDVKYAVVSKLNYKKETYFCFGDTNNGNFKILVSNKKDGKLIPVTDPNLIQTLLPLFLKDSINIMNFQVPDDDEDDY